MTITTVYVEPSSVNAIRRYLEAHRGEGFIAPYIAAQCGLEALPTMAALCHLLELGEVEIDVGHHTWTWQFSARKRA